MQDNTILIAGGGIGGLATGLSLLHAGYQVKIFEQASELGEVGAGGIQLSANATKVLKAQGILDKALVAGNKAKNMKICQFDTGDQLGEADFGDHLNKYGCHWIQFHRTDLLDVLAKEVLQLAPDCIHLNSVAESFAEDADGVILTLQNGDSHRGSLLIGADGLKSNIRTQICGEQEPIWTGYMIWRQVILAESVPDSVKEKEHAMFLGPGSNMYMYPVRQKTMWNVLASVECKPDQIEESWVMKGSWEDFKADFTGWCEDVQGMIEAADHEGVGRWALHKRLPMNNWSTDRVTLLGDAAHAMYMYHGFGAGVAIEDGFVLTRCLKQAGSVKEALQMYQRNRIPRATEIQLQSTKNLEIVRSVGKGEMTLQESMAVGASAESLAFWDRIYSYDPVNVPLT